MPLFEMTVGQGRDTLKCIWFNAAYLQDKFRAGMMVALYGKVEQSEFGRLRLQIMQPQFEILHDPAEASAGRRRQQVEVAGGGTHRSHLRGGRQRTAHGALVSPRDLRNAGATSSRTIPDAIPPDCSRDE